MAVLLSERNMSHYNSHRGRCMGRILHFVHYYLPYYLASSVKVGDGLFDGERQIAKLTWSTSFGEGDVPIFEFLGPVKKAEFHAQQETRRAEAIRDSIVMNDVEDKTPVNPETLKTIDIERFWRGPHLRAQIFKTTLEFFTGTPLPRLEMAHHNRSLFCKMGKSTYVWDTSSASLGWLLFLEEA